jgi:hypothetical protein
MAHSAEDSPAHRNNLLSAGLSLGGVLSVTKLRLASSTKPSGPKIPVPAASDFVEREIPAKHAIILRSRQLWSRGNSLLQYDRHL